MMSKNEERICEIKDRIDGIAVEKVELNNELNDLTQELSELLDEEKESLCPNCSTELVYSIDGDTTLDEKWSCPNCKYVK